MVKTKDHLSVIRLYLDIWLLDRLWRFLIDTSAQGLSDFDFCSCFMIAVFSDEHHRLYPAPRSLRIDFMISKDVMCETDADGGVIWFDQVSPFSGRHVTGLPLTRFSFMDLNNIMSSLYIIIPHTNQFQHESDLDWHPNICIL